MMGQHARSESLFYYFRIEDQVPENHLLRLLDRHISFDFVREKLKDFYSDTGRPSIDGLARRTRHHSLYSRERESCSQNQLIWDRKVHLRSGNKQLSVSGRKAAYLRRYQCHKSNACVCGHAEALSRLPAKSAMHQRPLPADRDSCPRTGATTGARAGDRAGLRGSATPTPESRSTLCGVEEPDRTAKSALAEDEACSRTILPRDYSPEPETTGSLPKIEISRISHGSDLDRKRERDSRRKITPAQNSRQWARFSTATRFITGDPWTYRSASTVVSR
jgi:hypothetical protein